jgi:hypothetical protein
MPVWPKSFYLFGASLQTARVARHLRRQGTAIPAQERTFAALRPRLAQAAFWKQSGLEAGMDYETFRRRVPLRGYEQLAPAIEQMKRGEAGVLWPGRCALFALSAGTTDGRPKALPVTDELLAHVRDARAASLWYYTARTGHAGIFRGRHLSLGGPTKLEPVPERNGSPAYAANLNGVAALSAAAWEERHLREPGAVVAGMTDWPASVNAIAEQARRLDISLLAGIPNWLLFLAQALREKNGGRNGAITMLRDLWPNLECCLHRGVPIAPFLGELGEVLGGATRFHEVYCAVEGYIAAQDAPAAAGLRLLAEHGIFFEFLPMAEFDEKRLEQLGPRAVPLAAVKPGVDYALLLTSPGGLARYLVGDIVRFVSTEPPRLVYVGRTRLRLDAFGERVNEKEVTDALVAVCAPRNWTIVNFHVAPLFLPSNTAQRRGRHEWWVELKPGTVATPTGPQMALELDADLQRTCPEYRAKRNGGGLEAPFVRLVMPGVFHHWLRFHGELGHEKKTPRCRSDRLIADELAQITNFARD